MATKEQGFFAHIAAAFRSLKSVPFPSSSSGTWWPVWSPSGFQGTQKDYTALAGDLTYSSLAMAAVRWLMNTISEPPIQVREMVNPNEDDEIVAEHPLVKLLNRPNQFYSTSTMWKGVACSWVLDDNAYLLKKRNNKRQVIELWYEPHVSIRAKVPQDHSEFVSGYELLRNGRWYPVDREDIVHFRNGINPHHPHYGLPSIRSVLREIYGDNEAANYYATLIAGSGVPPIVASIDTKGGTIDLTTEDLREIKARLEAQTTGDNKGKVLVAENIDIKKLAWTPQEMDIRVARYLAEERFTAVTGIPAVVLELGSAKEISIYNNVRQAQERATENYLVPLWSHIDEEMDTQLLNDFEPDETKRFIKHDLTKVRALQEDEDKKHERLRGDYKDGIVTLAEARRALGYKSEDTQEVYFVSPGQGPQPVPVNLNWPNPEGKPATNGNGASALAKT